MFAYKHQKLQLPVYTRMMDFLRQKVKEGIEKHRFLFITFQIVRYTLSPMTEKNSTPFPGIRNIQAILSCIQLSSTVLSRNLRRTTTRKENIWQLYLFAVITSISSNFFSRMKYLLVSLRDESWWNHSNLFYHKNQTKVFCCLKESVYFFLAKKHLNFNLLNIFGFE